jgi:hypothetical protein
MVIDRTLLHRAVSPIRSTFLWTSKRMRHLPLMSLSRAASPWISMLNQVEALLQ